MHNSFEKVFMGAGVSTGPEGAWDLSYAYFTRINTWDISTASYVQVFSVAGQESGLSGLSFKTDGTKMYVVGTAGDDVNEYDLSTAWDVSTASFNHLFSVSAQDIIPRGIFIKPDGTKMYIAGDTGNDINEYNLSTAWNVTSASFVQNLGVIGQDTSPQGIFFKPDGTKMYIAGNSGADVNEYNLSTAWDISTASYSQNFSVSAQNTQVSDIFFRDDGAKMYVVGYGDPEVNEYDLSTAWDISSSSFVQVFNVNSQETNPTALFFKPDGSKMYVAGYAGDDINEYSIGGGFSVATQETSPTGIFFKPEGDKMYIVGQVGDDVNEYDLAQIPPFSVTAQDTAPRSSIFKPDGTKMYVVGSAGDDVNEYDLSTAWDATTAVFLQNFSVAAQDTTPLGLFFKPDGTKMYITGSAGDDVNEYDLSTAWDVSSASYSQNFSVAAQEGLPAGLFFKPDGTKMYVVGSIGGDILEYSLSTAWDVSTASYSQNFSVSGQDINPDGLFFKPDGTKMYVAGGTDNSVSEYNLSTAWDISSSSFSYSFDVNPQEESIHGVFFKPDGTKMYIIGTQKDSVFQYDLSTAWDVSTADPARDPEKYFDISTASFSRLFSIASQEIYPADIFFKPDGTKMYIAGNQGDDVNEYNLSAAWNVSTASYSQSFSVSSQEVSIAGVFFKPDGTKMYVTGTSGDDVNEYDLSTAWDVSTASYSQNFSVAGQETSPNGLFFKPDGKKMYVVGATGDDVNEYDLSTAWDISTSSFNQLFGVANQTTAPKGIFFKPDGTEMFVVESSTDMVFPYAIGVQE